MPPKGLNNLSIDVDPEDEEVGVVRRSQSVCSPTRAAFALKTSMQRRRSSLTLAVSRPLMSIRNSILPTSTTEFHAPIGFDEYTTVAEETEEEDEESTPTSKINVESGQFGSPRSIGAPCNCSCDHADLREAYVMPEEPSYHKLFHGCVICGSRPAERLCMWCWKGYCTNHCKTHWTETSETHRVFVDSEMSSYESIFWCCKCRSFTVSEDFDEILEKLCEKGTYVDVPITDKHTNGYQSPTIRVVATTMQCWRSNNEDTYIVVPNLKQDPHITFFGVFDGHGGPLTARFVADHLPAILLKEPALNVGDYETALKASFLDVDEELKRQSDREEVGTCGTTATVILLTEGQIFCACAGDSRAVLCRRGRSLDLSVDHNPSNPNERERILAAGSSIQGEDRVDGLLGVSRAVGDFDFKQAGTLPPELQAVTAYPEVTVTPFTSEDQFIIVASDGLWNCLTSDEVVEYIQKQLKEHNDPKKAVESMLDSCVAAPIPEGGTDGGAGTDNITAILIVNDTASL